MKFSLEEDKVKKCIRFLQKAKFFLISNILFPGSKMLFHLGNMEGNR